MVKAEKKIKTSKSVKTTKSDTILSSNSNESIKNITKDIVVESKVSSSAEVVNESEAKEEPKTLPKIRLKVEEEAVKVKQFATAQGLSMHLKITKAKRAGLEALHKVATWLTPKNK